MEKIDIKLKKEVFGITPNDSVLYDAINTARCGLRQGTYSTKTRSEVSGGGRKPWRQKGTGRARQGSIRATQWRGGGIALGPKPRDYSIKMNRKERRLALLSALSYKNTNKEIIVVDEINLASNKTKDLVKELEKLGVNDKIVLIVMSELTDNMILASRNLLNVLLMEPSEINVLDIIDANVLLIEKKAVSDIEEALK